MKRTRARWQTSVERSLGNAIVVGFTALAHYRWQWRGAVGLAVFYVLDAAFAGWMMSRAPREA